MPKNSIKILLLIIFTQIFCCTVFLIPVSVNAIDPYKFQVPIGDLDEITFEKKGTTKPIADYIQAIYKYAIGVVAILATVVMMIGGVVWITAGGNQNRVGEAKQYISGSLTGLVLVFCSYMILNTINPDLVKFKPVGIETVSKIITGCCEKDNKHIGTITESECEEKKDGNWGGEDSVWINGSCGESNNLCPDGYNYVTSNKFVEEANTQCGFGNSETHNSYETSNDEYYCYKCKQNVPVGCCLSGWDGSEWDDCDPKIQVDCPAPQSWNEGQTCVDDGGFLDDDYHCE